MFSPVLVVKWIEVWTLIYPGVGVGRDFWFTVGVVTSFVLLIGLAQLIRDLFVSESLEDTTECDGSFSRT